MKVEGPNEIDGDVLELEKIREGLKELKTNLDEEPNKIEIALKLDSDLEEFGVDEAFRRKQAAFFKHVSR